ncbi:hypothetical protein FO519_001718 [Halicephalobus sp. NKZ332]|nr:hypothetical protein FO519_001718 [Halicephalobus sp. NKZ332]
MSSVEQRHTLCFNAAQRGEELCRTGQTEQGIEQLEKALSFGTNDVYLLSALYAQLGNAFYTLGDYEKAANYHSQDLLLCRAMNDKSGEANAFSNLAIARTSQKDFEKALPCVECQMNIAKERNDKTILCRAYYTKGYVYLQRAKDAAPSTQYGIQLFPYPVRKNSLPDDTREDVYTAIESFQKNSQLADELGDQNCCALAYANLGHAHFMLEELLIARSVADRPSMRRAFTNLGNAYFFGSKFSHAIENYKCAAQVAEEMSDKVLQAEAWYSIGITATVQAECETAASAHIRHLQLTRELNDRQAQTRSCNALASIYLAFQDIPKALYYFILKYKLAIEMRDHEMETKTRSSIRIAVQADPTSIVKEGRVVLDSSTDPETELLIASSSIDSPPIDTTSISFALREDSRAVSAPNLSEPLSKFIVDCAHGLKPMSMGLPVMGEHSYIARSMPNVKTNEEGDFIEMMEKLSKRIDDQRCDPSMLRDLTNNSTTRQADTLRNNSASKLYDYKSSGSLTRRSFIMSIKRPFTKGKKVKKRDSFPAVPTSTPMRHRAASLEISQLSEIKHHHGSTSTLNDAMSVISTPEPSGFRIPPVRWRESEKENVFQRSTSAQTFGGISTGSSETCASMGIRSLDPAALDFIDEADVEADESGFVPISGQRLRKPAADGIYNPETILDLIASIQSRRMNEQRADFLPGLRNRQIILNRFKEELEQRKKMVSSEEREVDEKLYELIMQCQSDRIEEQRSALGGTSPVEKDVTNIVMKMAAGRIEEQRADLKTPASKSPTSTSPPAEGR